MAITTLNQNDNGSTSRTVINDNFSDVTSGLALKANLDSPTFTGTPTLPTGTIATTQSAGDNSTKVATTAFVSSASVPTIETTAGTTHSLTTTANQKVIVWATGLTSIPTGSPGQITVDLKYDGTLKKSTTPRIVDTTGGTRIPFFLMYTETPGAGTKNVTVTASETFFDVTIIVMKIG